jgi:ComF family protein
LYEHLKMLGASLFDFCFPRRCAGCREIIVSSHIDSWCENCFESLAWVTPPLCPCCGIPFLDSPSSPDHLCGDCLLETYHFDSARSAALYAGIVRKLIHRLKFGGKLHCIPPLVDLLAATLDKHGPPDVDFVAPVPLHLKRLRQRGFNQSALLAKMLGRRRGLSVRFDALIRKNWTAPQTRLNRRERLENVKDAFNAPHPALVEGRSIILVDDVFTTGTTISECARVLKAAGASTVHALTVARALPDRKAAAE